MHVLMRDEKRGRKKQARSNKQQLRQSNSAHPRQSLFLRKMSCLGWDSNPRHSTLLTECSTIYMYTCTLHTHTLEVVGVVSPSGRAATEHHLILCEGTRLVREHILDLAQVLIDVESTTLERPVTRFIVHLHVPVDEVNLSKLDYLYSHVEGHGDDHLEGGEEGGGKGGKRGEGRGGGRERERGWRERRKGGRGRGEKEEDLI